MDAPYREAPSGEGRVVIARRSRSDLLVYLLLALTGVATPVFASEWGTRYPALWVLAFIAVPYGLFALARNLHAWFLPHAIELDDRGLRFAWADEVPYLPWMRREDREVPWSELRGVETHVFSVNGWSTTSLIVTTSDGSFSVPDARFDRSAPDVQREILDRLDRSRERPVGSVSAFVRACRERFATPLRLTASPKQVIGGAAFLLVFGGFFAWLAFEVPFWLTYGFAALCVLLFGGLTVSAALDWSRNRTLELGPDALAIGSRRIAWDTIRTVRRQVTNGKTDGLELLLADGSRMTLHLDYGRSFDELALLLDPNATTSASAAM
jgi:hypothetical protein